MIEISSCSIVGGRSEVQQFYTETKQALSSGYMLVSYVVHMHIQQSSCMPYHTWESTAGCFQRAQQHSLSSCKQGHVLQTRPERAADRWPQHKSAHYIRTYPHLLFNVIISMTTISGIRWFISVVLESAWTINSCTQSCLSPQSPLPLPPQNNLIVIKHLQESFVIC